MTTIAEYARQRFRRWGYTDSESRFISLVATHSGYFFLKHYADFISCASNKRTAAFIKKALSNGDIQARPYEHRGSKLYHLCARRVYAQLEQENSSLRKVRKAGSVTLARTRLLVTSFVVQHPHEAYFETEADKVAYFAQFGIGPERLPSKRYRNSKKRGFTVRYFPDKFPIFVAGLEEWKSQFRLETDRRTKRELRLYCRFAKLSVDQAIMRALEHLFKADADFGPWREQHKNCSGSTEPQPAIRPHVFFTYFDEGTAGMGEFAAWLRRYQPLLESLHGAYQVLYVSGSEHSFRRAERLFRNAFDSELKRETIQEHLRLRELWENKKYEKVSDKELLRLRTGRKKFSGPGYENLFTAWKLAASSEDKAALIPTTPMGRLSTILLGC